MQVCSLFSSPFLNADETRLDWVHDKRRSQFALQAICWEKSHIPKLVWQMGDATSNIIESLHADVNTEGIACSLVTGVRRGHHFDNLKLKTLSVSETHRPGENHIECLITGL